MKRLTSRFSLQPLRRLQWRLTLSYTLVTVAALAVVELILLVALLVFINSDFLVGALTQSLREEFVPQLRPYLERTPVDLQALDQWLVLFAQSEQTVDVSGSASWQFPSDQELMILDAQGILLATTFAETGVIGQALDPTAIPGLSDVLPNALKGTEIVQELYRIMPSGRLLLAIPVDGEGDTVLGALVIVTTLPTFNLATLSPLLRLMLLSLLPLTVAAGLIGTLFGFLTARSLSRRLGRLAEAADAWSQGDFSVVAADSSGDELGQLTRRLNRMAEQLQNLLETRQELATLEERNRLARDLHDSVKQQVFAGAMQAAAARALLETDPVAARTHLEEAEQLGRQAQQELAGLIQELRPAALEGRGLADAMRDYVDDWARRTGIEGQVRVQGERPSPLPVEQALFRIGQEALSNVARHSGARTADVHLVWTADDITLTISDDGRGFDVAEGERHGVGTQSMRERAEALGGTLTVSSEPNRGARVVARVATELLRTKEL